MINGIELEKWILLFFIYGFFGWIFECIVCSVNEGKIVNRGFLRGPIIPIYAFGAVSILIIVLPFKDNILLVYVFGLIVTTVLEYITGWAMEKIFKVRYWDYSNNKFNLNGHICLKSSVCWGFLACLLIYIIHPYILRIFTHFNVRELDFILGFLVGIFLVDFVYSVNTALHINVIIEEIHHSHVKILELQAQLKEINNGQYKGLIEQYGFKTVDELKVFLQTSIDETLNKLDKVYKRLNIVDRDFINSFNSAVVLHVNTTFKEIKSRIKKTK